MFLPALLIMVSTVSNLAEGIIIKKYNQKHSGGGPVFTGIVSLFSMLFFVITNEEGYCFTSEVFYWGIISAVLYASASLLTYISLECGSFAMTMLILSYTILMQIIYGIIFLNENASVFTYTGIAFLMISIYFMTGKDRERKKISVKWIAAVSATFLTCGLYGIVQRMQQIYFKDARTNQFMIVTLGLSAIILICYGMIKYGKKNIDVIKSGGIYAAFAGISNGITNFFGLVLYTLMPISIASPLKSGVKIIISFAASVLLFKEKFKKRQLVGLFLGTLAIIFLNT